MHVKRVDEFKLVGIGFRNAFVFRKHHADVRFFRRKGLRQRADDITEPAAFGKRKSFRSCKQDLEFIHLQAPSFG